MEFGRRVTVQSLIAPRSAGHDVISAGAQPSRHQVQTCLMHSHNRLGQGVADISNDRVTVKHSHYAGSHQPSRLSGSNNIWKRSTSELQVAEKAAPGILEAPVCPLPRRLQNVAMLKQKYRCQRSGEDCTQNREWRNERSIPEYQSPCRKVRPDPYNIGVKNNWQPSYNSWSRKHQIMHIPFSW
jgi:hypothetical protein